MTTVVKTKPFEGQKPGTSGLRKKVKVFTQPHYTENFIQACFTAISDDAKDGTLVVGGDGRYFLKECIDVIFKIGAASGVKKFIVGIDGILSTPNASNLIRELNANGGFILTASHNPGGIDNDFGVKYNCSNGGPAPEKVTNAIYENSTKICEYKIAKLNDYSLGTVGKFDLTDNCILEVVDGVQNYVDLMKRVFDFEKIRKIVTKPDFNMYIDSMSGVTGPYAKRIFETELGAKKGSVYRAVILDDFGGAHPDPNLTYAHELVEALHTGKYDFGAAFDGDGDRNMVLGRNAFVNPSDSIAIIAANFQAIPFFNKTGLKGVARSMPTSGALDRVAEKLGLKLYETPTGWKFFGNLMDSNNLSLCGEESFGQGSDHIREKDGIWAVLAWLSILAHTGKTVKEVIEDHWNTYGRNYFTRYDYEEVETEKADAMMNVLNQYIISGELIDVDLGGSNKVKTIDNFEYTDPIDGSVTSKQGIRILFHDNSRIIFRLSGTGSSGATIRMYVEKYQGDKNAVKVEASIALSELVNIALKISQLPEKTGRKSPTVIT